MSVVGNGGFGRKYEAQSGNQRASIKMIIKSESHLWEVITVGIVLVLGIAWGVVATINHSLQREITIEFKSPRLDFHLRKLNEPILK